jgi:hypothetical protein
MQLHNISIKGLLLSLLIIFFASCSKNEDTKPPNNTDITDEVLPAGDTLNKGMEYWKKTTQNNITYYEPSGLWATLNPLSKLNGPVTVSRTTDKHTGNYAVKLESKTWGADTNSQGLLIPGLLTIGSFVNVHPWVIQGKPFNSKPQSLEGYFKYTSVENDSAIIYAKLSRYNFQLNKQDTIAEAKFIVKNTVTSYQQFNAQFVYYIQNINPDTLSMVFVSSGGGQNFQGKAGSTLYIDDIRFVYNK